MTPAVHIDLDKYAASDLYRSSRPTGERDQLDDDALAASQAGLSYGMYKAAQRDAAKANPTPAPAPALKGDKPKPDWHPAQTDEMAEFGQYLKRVRHRMELSVRKLSAITSLSCTVLQRIEKGEYRATEATREKLSLSLGIDVDKRELPAPVEHINEPIGHYLRRQRNKLKMSINTVTAALHLGKCTLTAIEKGTKQPNADTLRDLSKMYGVDVTKREEVQVDD